MSSVWDDPEIRAGGEYFKFERVGDEITGTVAAVRIHRFDDNQAAPQIILTTDDGEERTVTAGQVLLKRQLSEQRPEVGDWIKVKLAEIEKRAGGKELKHFDLQVRRNGGESRPATTGQATAATPAAAPPGMEMTPELRAAIANLPPEQKTALGLPA